MSSVAARLALFNRMADCFFNQVFLLMYVGMRVHRKMRLLMAGFLFFTITNNAEMNIFVHVALSTYTTVFLEGNLGVKLLDPIE